MSLKKYSFGDIMKEIDESVSVWDNFWARPTFTFIKGEIYDPEQYELVPRRNHLENRLKEKEQQLSNIEGIQKHYTEQQKKIQEEIEELKKLIDKK
jgi:hypothetical protein